MHAKYVTIKKFEELTGYSEKAVRMKIEEGVFMQGRQWHKAPDGRVLIDMEGYESWANPRGCQEGSKSTARS